MTAGRESGYVKADNTSKVTVQPPGDNEDELVLGVSVECHQCSSGILLMLTVYHSIIVTITLSCFDALTPLLFVSRIFYNRYGLLIF